MDNSIREKKSNNSVATVVVVTASLLLWGLFGYLGWRYFFQSSNRLMPEADNTSPVIDTSGAIDKNSYQFVDQKISISDVVERISPSVVSVLTTVDARTFWGESSVQQGAGSGVVLSKDGYILTNKHVVSGAKSVVVVLSDGQAYENVEIVFSDPMNDLAFLKIKEVSHLKPIEIGDSKTIRVGQPVLAIGNALGEYQNTVTDGIVSGVGRNIIAQSDSGYGAVRSEGLTDLIQTNAAINSGNSGGPLVNAGGQLIGINTAVAHNAHGIGFAIPIGAAKGVIKQLGGVDAIKRGYVGVSYVEATPAIAKQYNLPLTRGALVGPNNGIRADSPAEIAGLRDGDIITKVNGFEVGVIGSVATLVAEYKPGEAIELTLRRGDDTKDVKIIVGSY